MPYIHVDMDEIIDYLSRADYDEAIRKGIETGKIRPSVELVPEILKAAGCPETIWRLVRDWVNEPELNFHHLEAWRAKCQPVSLNIDQG